MKMRSNYPIYFFLFAVGLGLLAGCSEDDDAGPTTDLETITTLQLTIQDQQGNTNVYEYADDGVNVTADQINLTSNNTYTLSASFLDETDPSNPIDRTEEIRDAGTLHLVCFGTTLGSPIQTFTITDTDTNGDQLGLEAEMVIGDVGSSMLQVLLKHEPDKNNSQACNTGAIDFNATFDIVVSGPTTPASVTEIEMSFNDGSASESFVWTDQDGPGGISPVADDIELGTCEVYTLDINFKDITQSPAVNINQTIGANAMDYIVLLQLDGMSQTAETMAMDLDGNQLPVGTSWSFKSGAKSSGTLTVTLKKGADKTDPENTGTVEAEAEFALAFINTLENINYVTLVFTDQNSNELTFSKGDPDGPGGQSAVNERIQLDAQSSYSMDIKLFDTNQTPPVELTEKISCEGADHYVIFLNTGIGLNIARADLDEDGLPVGLENTLQTFAPANGQLRITLKDNIDKFQPFTTGDVEYEGTFNMTAQ